MTDPAVVASFLAATKVDALAVCVPLSRLLPRFRVAVHPPPRPLAR